MADNRPALQQLGRQLVKEIQDNIDRAGHSTSGRTKRSVQEVVTRASLVIQADAQILTLEDPGRKPTQRSGGGGKSLIDQIKEWIQKKGLANRLNPWAVANVIHKEGTLIHRLAKRGVVKRDIFSNVLTRSRLEAFVATFGRATGDELLGEVFERFNKAVRI